VPEFDYCIIGGGIAGLSIGWELAAHGRVILLERESQLAYHATGRSAALFAESYGNAAVRALTRASRGFYFNPPEGFAAQPLVSDRGALYIATEAQRAELTNFQREVSDGSAPLHWLDGDEARDRVPILSAAIAGACLDTAVCDIDVGAVVDGYRRGFRARGGVIWSDASVHGIERLPTGWRVAAGAQHPTARTLVNAAGAWADEIGQLAGAAPIGLEPRRRTAAIVDLPAGISPRAWPMVIDVSEQFYFKPDTDRLLISPADEVPSPPCDAQPQDLDVAEAVDRIERVTTLTISRVNRAWAGLRTFAPDRSPVIGFDPRIEGLFWFAGQGGYGFQLAPAAARAAIALVLGKAAPIFESTPEVSEALLSPRRFSGVPQQRSR
jgi:D-arginine dehydrogenase